MKSVDKDHANNDDDAVNEHGDNHGRIVIRVKRKKNTNRETMMTTKYGEKKT